MTATSGVHTPWVRGREEDAGWIEFPSKGLNVFHGAAAERLWGTVSASEADLNDLFTRRAKTEHLTVETGLTVDGVLETQDGPPRLVVHGRLDAEGDLKADRNAVVGGALTVAGQVDAGGELHATSNAVVDGDLIVNGKLELDALLVAREATVGGDLTVNGRADVLGGLRSAGETVIGDDLTVDGGLGVRGESAFSGKVNANAHLSVRNGSDWILHTDDDLISVNGGLRVQEESLFLGKVNANGRLSVRNGTDWLVHVNDDQVAIQGSLRVHGAFHSDS
ncbi:MULTISPECIES: polymer-forming cytoskeletal protein [Streptomyces]|uniref:Polymer-forming cytoskeletal protein n=1 Tax=Streptomyces glycanivorans TaxID=3033808 RepID=A0ABY9J735_9ACTN|nr:MULTISPECIES: polymer-forming cytoskeletal protein [unclassified Streptomyces]WLQ62174.1 polymer-forming cytoskeletal protein [Streptomyces sp. Alt3]WSQ75683.1 polymer-forming cytoskeletal protein [Streptomyces sp. NBC_01213]WSQ82927.1 polymer-forming cytoskeletal protein [Streptomyces sp. NBC_01212]WSR46261.1 polymer-forming cytoskeletal protein [Streptomyces sp. NBC_01201]